MARRRPRGGQGRAGRRATTGGRRTRNRLPGHGRCADEPPARLEGGPRRGPERADVDQRQRGPGPKDDLAGQTIDPDAVDPPELVERERGHAQEDRHPSHCHREPGGRVSGDSVGGGAHLNRDRGGQCRVQAGGQSQVGGQSLTRLVLWVPKCVLNARRT